MEIALLSGAYKNAGDFLIETALNANNSRREYTCLFKK